MLNIRQNMFETNSSSVHSLVIYHEDLDRSFFNYQIKYPMTIKGGYYGRGYPKILATRQDKLNYIWMAIVYLFCKFDFDLEKIEHSDDSLYWMEILKEIAPNATFIVPQFEDYDKGVDHCGNLENFFKECKKDNQILKDLILEDNSFIIVEGDEYCMIIYAFYPDYWTNEEELIDLRKNYKIYVKGN